MYGYSHQQPAAWCFGVIFVVSILYTTVLSSGREKVSGPLLLGVESIIHQMEESV